MLILKTKILIHICICIRNLIPTTLAFGKIRSSTQSLEDLALYYEDEKNAMIAVTGKDNSNLYEEFYETMDNRLSADASMNVIFFGPVATFMRLDSETLLHILHYTMKEKITIARALLAWDMITDGKTAAYLQGREFLAFGSLLNHIPEEDLYYVNFGDQTVINFFANHFVNLHSRKFHDCTVDSRSTCTFCTLDCSYFKGIIKFGILASAYRRYYGNSWFRNGSHINELGYLMCAFPFYDLEQIPPKVFIQIKVESFTKLKRCSMKQTKTLYNIATHPEAYGEPYKWASDDVARLGALFIRTPNKDIGTIQLEAMTGITPAVIKLMDQAKLQYFSKQQILRMTPKTRRIYILRMQLSVGFDVDHLSSPNA